jgi:hypothetical protein
MTTTKPTPVRRTSTTRPATAFYVSTTGNDRWSGTVPEPTPDRRDGPFATLDRAQDAVRRLRRRQPRLRGPVRVHLRGGTHFLKRPLTFTPADSGTAQSPTVYCAYAGEAPVLSGGVRLRDWQLGTHHGQACWTVDLPAVRAGRWNFTQLFVNGQRRWRPRLPKTGYHRFAGTPDGLPAPTGRWHEGPDCALCAPGDLQAWRNLDDVKLVMLTLWFEAHHRIKELDVARNFVRFRGRCLNPTLKDEKGEFARYFVENVFEALDTPGEWYLDRPAGRLHYLPAAGEQPDTAEVIAPRLAELVRFAGTDRKLVAYVWLENLSLQHADWDYPPDDPGSIQAAFKVPGAVVFDRA